MNPPAGMFTGGGNASVCGQVGTWCEMHKQGQVFSNTGYYLPDGSMMSPGISYLTAETLAKLPREECKGFPHIYPNFTIELISETDTLASSKKKMVRWTENGVELGWLIEPDKERVFVYTTGVMNPVVATGASVAGTGCVEGFQLDLKELWDWYRS